MCWGIYHAYDGISTKDIREPTPDLINALVEEIIDTTAMELAIAELFDYRSQKGLESRLAPHPIGDYAP